MPLHTIASGTSAESIEPLSSLSSCASIAVTCRDDDDRVGDPTTAQRVRLEDDSAVRPGEVTTDTAQREHREPAMRSC